MLYTVGEMAKRLQVTPSTLRYYDKEGLLPFVERSEGGIRMFKDNDYEFLKIIECLKSTGMQLKDIKKFIFLVLEGDSSINERLELFKKRQEEVEKQIEKLQNTLNVVKYKCWFYETAKEAGTTSVPENMTLDRIPEEFRKTKQQLSNK